MTAKVINVKAEVVGPAYAEGSQPRVGTLKAEVVGASFAQQFARARVNALKAEVVVSAIRRSKGFSLPSIPVEDFTLFVVFKPRNWETEPQKILSLLHTDPQHGIFLRRQGVQLELYMRYGETGEVSVLCAVPSFNEGLIVSIAFNPNSKDVVFRVNQEGFVSPPTVSGDWGNFTFANLGGYLQTAESQDHSIAEVILFRGTQPGTNIEAIERFLFCRWFGPGPNEDNNFCIPS